MSNVPDIPEIPDANDIALVPSGKVKQIQQPDLNAQFETTAESTQGQINEITLKSMRRGLVFRSVSNGRRKPKGGC